jgi:hypothetical protein
LDLVCFCGCLYKEKGEEMTEMRRNEENALPVGEMK